MTGLGPAGRIFHPDADLECHITAFSLQNVLVQREPHTASLPRLGVRKGDLST